MHRQHNFQRFTLSLMIEPRLIHKHCSDNLGFSKLDMSLNPYIAGR